MIRIGYGYDVHRLVEGRRLVLGGVVIPFSKGLLGHSDADVLLHAISDSILGAASLGDIGGMFPDSNDEFKDADSLDLLRKVINRVKKNGYYLINIDSTIVAQEPKLLPYIYQMRCNIADACEIDKDFISVKATTEEGLGFSGNGEGISSHAVCLLENMDKHLIIG